MYQKLVRNNEYKEEFKLVNKCSKLEIRSIRNGLLFISPYIVGFSVFFLYPFIFSLYYGFTSYSVLRTPEWTGLLNYKLLFIEDTLFRISVYNTLYYTAFFVLFALVADLIIALLLTTHIKGKSILRLIYFLPSIIPFAAMALLWLWLFNARWGIINQTLRALNIFAPAWFSDPKWSKPGLIIMMTWASGRMIVILLAGIQGIPRQLYEVAELDGANWWQQFVHVTLPLLTPIILFVIIMSMIQSFQLFTQPYIMTNGGPANSTLFYSIYLYRTAFRYFKLGYGSAIATVFFFIVLICTLAILKSSARWVYYERKR